ncbi:hypothetical protein [Photobacterium damselae]|uniref:hypothetical protein n=1 Tax=Photobacterium damselae TaxID=38293 RepID=UPI0040683EA2
MSQIHALRAIATSIGFNCNDCNFSISVDSNCGDRVVIDFENFDVNELESDELKDLLKQIFTTAKTIETNHLIQTISLQYDGAIKLTAHLTSSITIEYKDEFFVSDVYEINNAITEILVADEKMKESVNSIQAELTKIEDVLSFMPEKGLISPNSQKVYVRQCLNNLDHAINGISLLDFLENWG